MLPIILKIRLATMMMAGWSASATPTPMPTETVATMFAARTAGPVAVSFYDENEHQAATIAIWRDGSLDDATKETVKHLFRCRTTHREHMIAAKTLAMLADVSEHWDGKVLEYVSAYRVGHNESSTSPHRAARAVDFRIRGIQLREIRDYLWTTYTSVGVGWYPVEQFVHIDTRPGQQDMSWTFLNGVNHYHPFWAELARDPQMQARIAASRAAHHAGT